MGAAPPAKSFISAPRPNASFDGYGYRRRVLPLLALAQKPLKVVLDLGVLLALGADS